MSLTNYTTLQAEIEEWLNRTDLTAKVPVFITLCEAQMMRQLRRKTARATITISAQSTTLPADCAELRSIVLVTGSTWLDRPLNIGTPEQLADTRALRAGLGRPTAACIIGTALVVAPTPDNTYSADITYYQQLTPLSGGAPTNTILTEAPDAYLFGALAQSAPYLEHDERIPVWQAKYDAAIAELNNVRQNEEMGASIRPMRLAVSF